MIYLTFLLLNIAHYIGDYTHLSTNWMLNAKSKGTPLLPIFVHALTHAILFSLVIFAIHGIDDVLLVFSIQLLSHFAIDVLKGKLNVWIPTVSKPMNRSHWYIFGLDQFLHQSIIILTIYTISPF